MSATRPQQPQITAIKAFTDNYIWCLSLESSAIVVDPGDASPVLAYLKKHNLVLKSILITHHHWDHVGGIDALLEAFPNIPVYGPHNPKIKQISHRLSEHDSIVLPDINTKFTVLETPGHTLDHIVYYNDDWLFCGDTLFSGGCGRMFEGEPSMFWRSLQKLSTLPSKLKVYCTHEYTQANVNFARSVDPNNEKLQAYFNWVNKQREQNQITLPTTIQQELEINPFLRCHTSSIKQNLHLDPLDTPESHINTFARLRKLKDEY